MTTPGLVFLRSYRDSIRHIPQNERVYIYEALIDYCFDDVEPTEETLSPYGMAVFDALKPSIKSSVKRYSDCVENGKKGGRPRKNAKKSETADVTEEKTEPKAEEQVSPQLSTDFSTTGTPDSRVSNISTEFSTPVSETANVTSEDAVPDEKTRVSENQNPAFFSENLNKDKDKDRDTDMDMDMDMDMDTDRECECVAPASTLPHTHTHEGEKYFSDQELTDTYESWIRYKQERHEHVGKEALRNLRNKMRSNAEVYGPHMVAELMRDCMSSEWKNIVWTRLRREPPVSRGQTRWDGARRGVGRGVGVGVSLNVVPPDVTKGGGLDGSPSGERVRQTREAIATYNRLCGV